MNFNPQYRNGTPYDFSYVYNPQQLKSKPLQKQNSFTNAIFVDGHLQCQSNYDYNGLKASFTGNNELIIKEEPDSKGSISKTKYTTSDSLNNLSNDMYSMFENAQFTDVTIKCDDKAFKVHKSILCARSAVFMAMFSNDMRENKDNVIVINDIESETLHKFLQFIYGGQITDLHVPIACNLMYTAEKYEIEILKQMCYSYLKSNISTENAFQMLQCGHLYYDPLKSFSLRYVAKNFASLRAAEAWKNLQSSNSALALEVYSCVVDGLLK